MKALILAALMSVTLTGTAMAQTHREQPRAQNMRSPVENRNHDQRGPARAQSRTTNHTPPRTWKKSRSAYQTHVTACQRRYKSYNPRTDTFNRGRGRIATCRL